MKYWARKYLPTPISPKFGKQSKRKKAASKKLRVNGKFVSSKQAMSLLWMTKKDFSKALKKQTKVPKRKRIDAEVIKKESAIKVCNA